MWAHTYRGRVHIPRQKLRDNRKSGGDERADHEAKDADDDGVGHDIGDEPPEELHDEAYGDVDEDHGPLAEFVCDVRKEKAAERQAAPKAGGNVPDLVRGAAPYGNKKLDHPA